MTDLLATAKKHESVVGKPMTEWMSTDIQSFAEALRRRRQNADNKEDYQNAENR